MWLKVAPIRGTVIFGQRGKLAPRFFRPYDILERIGKDAYKLTLSRSMLAVHNVFHVSMLKKCLMDDKNTIDIEDVQLEPYLTYQEVSIAILDHDTRELRNKLILMVKIQWSHHSDREGT